MNNISTQQLETALRDLGMPGGRQMRFLQAHYDAPGRATTASVLATKVGYRSYSGINLQYGILAHKIAAQIGLPPVGIGILIDFVQPPTVTNEHWILVMKPEFAEALVAAGWVTHEPTVLAASSSM